MKKRTFTLLIAACIVMSTVLVASGSALTDEEAKTYGPGFHEPGDDWWDSTYKYRIPVNASNTRAMGTYVTGTGIDFSDYFTHSDGIVDLASMQLVKVMANETSAPVAFQLETDAVDFWNPVTLPEIQDEIIDVVLARNGTCIGTVFNPTGVGPSYTNISVRFKVFLSNPSDEVVFQFIHDAPKSKGVGSNDYLRIYAGVPGDWGSPVRVYRRDLPDVATWTSYIHLQLPSSMEGDVWINMDAPSLENKIDSHFSIGYSFADGDGYRTVIHTMPEISRVIEQSNYYPRVQVLQHENPPFCAMYFLASNVNERFYLYFNFMNESNGRVIDNIAVPLINEIDFFATYYFAEFPNGTAIIDKDRSGFDGKVEVTTSLIQNESWGTMLGPGFDHSGAGYDTYNKLGSICSYIVYKNSTATMTFSMFKDSDFIQVNVNTTNPMTIDNTFSDANIDDPFNWMATDSIAFGISSIPVVETFDEYATDANILASPFWDDLYGDPVNSTRWFKRVTVGGNASGKLKVTDLSALGAMYNFHGVPMPHLPTNDNQYTISFSIIPRVGGTHVFIDDYIHLQFSDAIHVWNGSWHDTAYAITMGMQYDVTILFYSTTDCTITVNGTTIETRPWEFSTMMTVPVETITFASNKSNNYEFDVLDARGSWSIPDPEVDGDPGESSVFSFFNADDPIYTMLAFEDDAGYIIDINENKHYEYMVRLTIPDGMTTFAMRIIDARVPHSPSNQSAIISQGNVMRNLLVSGLDHPISVTTGDAQQFMPVEIHYVGDGFTLNIAYVGDIIEVALFGHSLQSMSVVIDNTTTPVPINGTWRINVTALNRSILQRYHVITITGRNEFGQTDTVELKLWIANDYIDVVWVLVIALFNPLTLVGTAVVTGLLTVALIKNKRVVKASKSCIGGKCNI